DRSKSTDLTEKEPAMRASIVLEREGRAGRRFEHCCLLPAVLWALFGSAPSAVAGGRICACEEHLSRLDPQLVPGDLRPGEKLPEVIAAFKMGDRPVTSLEFLGMGATLAVAEFGPTRRGEGTAGSMLIFDLKGKAPRQ